MKRIKSDFAANTADRCVAAKQNPIKDDAINSTGLSLHTMALVFNFTEFYRGLPSCTEFYRVLLSFTEYYLVLLGFTGFY